MVARTSAFIGLAALLLYCCWIGWPYLESIVVRDAAVTSWVNVTDLADQRIHDEPALLRRLNAQGLLAQAAFDVARARVAELERDFSAAQAELARDSERHRAAAAGVYLLNDGADGTAVLQNLAEARVRLAQAEATLTELRAEEDAARIVWMQRAPRMTRRARSTSSPPPRWCGTSSRGSTCRCSPARPWSCGWTAARCSSTYPVSDVEAALLHRGSKADVVIEGERRSRRGRDMIRGSAGTLDHEDIASVAKGRRAGVGQAIVQLEPTADDIRLCPIGEDAFADFPDVGALQILRARLRW